MKYALIWFYENNKSDHAIFDEHDHIIEALNQLKIHPSVTVAEAMTIDNEGAKLETIELYRQ